MGHVEQAILSKIRQRLKVLPNLVTLAEMQCNLVALVFKRF